MTASVNWVTGRKSSINTTAVTITETDIKANKGVQVYVLADGDNNDAIGE